MNREAHTVEKIPLSSYLKIDRYRSIGSPPLAWILLILYAVIAYIGACGVGLSVDPALITNMLVSGLYGVAWLVGAWCMAAKGRLFAFSHTLLIMHLFIATSLVMCFAAAMHGAPLIDETLARADHTLGFDWVTSNGWVEAHPTLVAVLRLSYISMTPQMVVVCGILAWLKKNTQMWELFWLALIILTLCLIASINIPAAGPFAYYNIHSDRHYVTVFRAFHDGTAHVLTGKMVAGIISFPSFHAAMGVLYIYAARGIKLFFPTMLVLNLIMIASTLYIGGHYLVDTLAGVILALAVIGCSEGCLQIYKRRYG